MLLNLHELKEIPYYPGDTITLDDGLYSQYLYKPKQKSIFFINPGYLNNTGEYIDFITCRNAHTLAFKGDYRPYMSLNHILELQELGHEIGLHGFWHQKFRSFRDFQNDLYHGIKFFEKHNISLKKYCFAYNQNTPGNALTSVMELYLEKLGYEVFGYGREVLNV